MRDEEIERLASRLDSLLEYLINRAEPEVAVVVAELIEGLERMHAEGLRRLVARLPRDPEQLGAALRDPAISALFEMYDLSVTLPDLDPLDPGGVSPTGDVSVVAPERLVQLRKRFSAKKGAEAAPPAPIGRIAEVPLDEVPAGTLHGMKAGDVALLLLRRGDEVFAFRNACPGTPFPLHHAQIEGGTIVCPWHGCRFLIDTGAREESQQGPPLEVFPVEEVGDVIRVALP